MVTKSDTATNLFETLSSELRRGVITLAVLAQCRTAQYGYSLKQNLADAGLEVNEGTLYPLMRRLEDQGLLSSEWRIVDEGRPRRYYLLSKPGAEALALLAQDWSGVVRSMNNLLGE